jgi:hypothetical protein
VWKKKLVLSRYSDQITQFNGLQDAADRASYLKYNITPPSPKISDEGLWFFVLIFSYCFSKQRKIIFCI